MATRRQRRHGAVLYREGSEDDRDGEAGNFSVYAPHPLVSSSIDGDGGHPSLRAADSRRRLHSGNNSVGVDECVELRRRSGRSSANHRRPHSRSVDSVGWIPS
eukprot:gene252-biopygen4562